MQVHNKAREEKGVSPIAWDDDCASLAQVWQTRPIATIAYTPPILST
jgi:uncharacterized protein YkwD